MSHVLKRRRLLAAGAAVALLAASGRSEQLDASQRPFTSDRITVVTRGRGPDIVLIPGLASSRAVWNPVADTLQDRYRLHLVQVNGFAGLPPGPNAAGPVTAPVAEEIARYIREARVERPAVIGHSMGGSIAMLVAARHPEIVGALLIEDMPPYIGVMFGPADGTPEALRAAADGMRDKILADPNTLEQMFGDMTRMDALKPMLTDGVRTSDRRTAASALHELLQLDLRPQLSRITAPTTVLYIHPPEAKIPAADFDRAMRESFQNAKGARLVRIEDSKHFIHFDQPAQFVREVDELMKRRR